MSMSKPTTRKPAWTNASQGQTDVAKTEDGNDGLAAFDASDQGIRGIRGSRGWPGMGCVRRLSWVAVGVGVWARQG